VEFLGGEFLIFEGFARFVAGIAGQEGDQKFTRMDAGPFCEGIFGDDTPEFSGSAKNDVGGAVEFFFDGGLDVFGN